MQIGLQLKNLRQIAAIRQVDLSDALKISQAHISRIEGGTPTTTDVIERWVEVCGGEIRISRPDIDDPLAPLVTLAQKLSVEDQEWLTTLVALVLRAKGPNVQFIKDMAISGLEKLILPTNSEVLDPMPGRPRGEEEKDLTVRPAKRPMSQPRKE